MDQGQFPSPRYTGTTTLAVYRRTKRKRAGLLVAKRAEHPGFHVIGVMAVKCPLTGVVSDQVGDHGFTVAEKDGVLA